MSRTHPPSFDFYPDDFVSGVRDMTCEEVGAYVLLLCWQFRQGSIPDDRRRLKLICGGLTDEEYDRIMPKPLGKFLRINDGINDVAFCNERMDFERTKKLNQHKANIRNGRKGGRPKKLRSQKSENPNETHRLTQKEPNGKKEVGSRNKEVIRNKKDKIGSRFDEFWAAYPTGRKGGKKGCESAYVRAVKSIAGRDGPGCDDPEAWLVARAKAYAASEKGQGEFVLSVGRWLNQGHYDDDAASWRDLRPAGNAVSRNAQVAANVIAKLREAENDST